MSDAVDRQAMAHLARMPDAFRAQLEPLVAPDAADPWLRDVLLAYLRYLTRVLDLEEPREGSEAQLVDDLAALAGTTRSGPLDDDLETAEGALRGELHRRGFQFLGGRTPPHLGAYIWRRTETRSFPVTLPAGEPQTVDVHLMHDFVLRGWLYWSTFGTQGAGGWFQDGDPDWPDGLYCVRDRYGEPLEDDAAFRVSLLGHEAQHVADHRAFPDLTSNELEYRAKLVELIGYDAVDDRLRAFLADAADDPERPHPHAAHLIVTRLADRLLGQPPTDVDWAAIDYVAIRDTSRALLDEDTARLAAGR